MTDVPTGGRIVPVVKAHQHYYSISPADEVVAIQHQPAQQLTTQPPQPQQEQEQEEDSDGRSDQKTQPQSQAKSSRSTRSKNVETESLELPCLNKLGLYALPTEGDGNCLYYALSDQLYGDFTHADQIRVRLADHIAANKDYFMNFIAAVGGERRAPRRAAASAARYSYCSSSSASPAPPSSKDKERNFDSKVAESRKKGVWGGAEEIQAFCQSFKKDVNVYTMYGIQNFRDVHASDEEEREIVHIAFHDFHHYSSVRHTEGPHTGLPCIPKADQTLQKDASSTGPTVVDMASPWKISAIQEGLGGKYDRDTIVGMLQQCRGNIDRAFINLLSEDTSAHPTETSASRAIMKSRLQPSSRSSSPFSTGSKRSADDSELEDNPQPATRRSRTRDQKRRILPDVTVGIAFRDDQNDLVSLRLRVSPDAVAERAMARETTGPTDSDSFESGTDRPGVLEKDKKSRIKQKPASSEPISQKNDTKEEQKPRRSQRLTRSRNAPKPI
ncbi:hypothetical protein BDV28DRAFT_158654 [Aspergillus coremiiformis]|uniref:OTU domain-containing protein n=1 Tax=Aspergillus coremiiformis TaxID=138285 RepID=A0A5N6Z1I3_9EURO|nr:hypothetical protein BDV28DRAFT_158654 [Aspergillus coremiiformis]